MPRKQKSGKSPYQRYGKTPYAYQFKRCAHKETVRQAVTGETRSGQHFQWLGKVCTVCNIVRDGPYL